MRSLSLVAGMVLLACDAAVERPSALHAGALVYRATTLQGAPLLAGSLDLSYPDDSSVTGTWSITWDQGADTSVPVGPQIGSGTLTGHRAGDSVYLDLSPAYADNNAMLLAQATLNGLTGRWQWSTIAGPQAEGLFTAARQ